MRFLIFFSLFSDFTESKFSNCYFSSSAVISTLRTPTVSPAIITTPRFDASWKLFQSAEKWVEFFIIHIWNWNRGLNNWDYEWQCCESCNHKTCIYWLVAHQWKSRYLVKPKFNACFMFVSHLRHKTSHLFAFPAPVDVISASPCISR